MLARAPHGGFPEAFASTARNLDGMQVGVLMAGAADARSPQGAAH
ncbi:MAG: hypothetical protein ACRDYA_08250 [Egibacteraceae bacterium]